MVMSFVYDKNENIIYSYKPNTTPKIKEYHYNSELPNNFDIDNLVDYDEESASVTIDT